MRPHTLIFVATFAVIAGACLLSRGDGPPASQPSPIPLSELWERGVAGRLGPRMGTIVEVTGVVVENKSNAKADVSEPFFLRVDSVEGRKLDKPQLFSSSAMQLIRGVPALKVGDSFRCIGYERGGFRGSPDGEFKHVEAHATQGFFFNVEFVVLKAS